MNTSLAARRKYSSDKLKFNSSIKSVEGSNYLTEKAEFEKDLNRVAFSYYQYKLQHNGITSFKGFENCTRSIHRNSMSNLLNYSPDSNPEAESSIPFDNCFGYLDNSKELTRSLSEKQSKKIKKYANKLCYYSATRHFKSEKSGSYKFKVAFITLTAPESASDTQKLRAFEHFLDYLRRTANCVYIWKKELGKKSNQLHFHIMVNNFIPYYLISWKWKRLLMSEGVEWPINDKGKHTDSHYRIELPRNVKMAGHYIAKYMAKVEGLDKSLGYLWGKSKILDECKEIVLTEESSINGDLYQIYQKYKTIGSDFVKHCCVDLLKVKDIAPEIFKIFEKQFYDFQAAISLPQKFKFV